MVPSDRGACDPIIRSFETIARSTGRVYGDPHKKREHMAKRIALQLRCLVDKEWDRVADSRPDENAAGGDHAAPVVEPIATETLDEVKAELMRLIGLEPVKRDFLSISNLLRVRQLRKQHDLNTEPLSLHLVFTGNPGTGKTTIARLLARAYRALGVLSKGHLVEVDRSGLVAGTSGMPHLKPRKWRRARSTECCSSMRRTRSSARVRISARAINTLLKFMEDHRERLIVIVAGYTEPMMAFLESNPGLRSRFNKFIHFEDYSVPEMARIFEYMLEKAQFRATEQAGMGIEPAMQRIREIPGEHFGNGRVVRNLLEHVQQAQANRLATSDEPTVDDLLTVEAGDIQAAIDEILAAQKSKRDADHS